MAPLVVRQVTRGFCPLVFFFRAEPSGKEMSEAVLLLHRPASARNGVLGNCEFGRPTTRFGQWRSIYTSWFFSMIRADIENMAQGFLANERWENSRLAILTYDRFA